MSLAATTVSVEISDNTNWVGSLTYHKTARWATMDFKLNLNKKQMKSGTTHLTILKVF